jgi:hypothetical protein
VGQNINVEPMDPPGPSTTDQGAYLAYLQPLLPPVLSSTSNIVNITLDGSAHHDQWNSLTGATDGQLPQFVYPIDSNHNPWALMPHSNSPPNNNNGLAEQTGMSVGGIRIGGVDSTNQQPIYGGVRPFGAGMIPREEGSSGNLFYSREWAHSGPHSPVNNEAVWTSSSQQQPSPSAPEPASARSPPSSPQENDNTSPHET